MFYPEYKSLVPTHLEYAAIFLLFRDTTAVPKFDLVLVPTLMATHQKNEKFAAKSNKNDTQNQKLQLEPKCIDYEMKPILRSDEKKRTGVISARGTEEAGC